MPQADIPHPYELPALSSYKIPVSASVCSDNSRNFQITEGMMPQLLYTADLSACIGGSPVRKLIANESKPKKISGKSALVTETENLTSIQQQLSSKNCICVAGHLHNR